MKSRVQGVQDRLVQNGRKIARKGKVEMSTIPAETEDTKGYVLDEKPINVFQTMILKALNNPRLGKHIYSGSVRDFRPEVVEKRRAKNKVARKQRRVNRAK